MIHKASLRSAGGGGPAPASLRSRLRAGTREKHARLDAAFRSLETGSAASYRRFLAVNEACHRMIEPALAASGLIEAMPALARDGRRAAARADLDAMGLRPIVLDPFAPGSPALCEGVGIAYVLEGSRLGARAILKGLRASGGAEADRPPTAFLEAAGDAERFRDFMRSAEALVAARGGDGERAVRSADATFDYFLKAVRVADAAHGDGGTT